MLRNLKLWQKLGLLSLAFVIPTLVLVVLLRQEKNLAIDFAEKESAGNHYLGGLKSVLEGLPLYGMTGDSGAAAKVEGGFKVLDAAEAQYGAMLNTSQRLSTLKDQWQKVRLNYVSPGRNFFVFTRGRKHQETISLTARMLARMCESNRLRAVEHAYLMERATARARRQLAALKASPSKH